MRVNVVARGSGWLFGDLKGLYEQASSPDVEIISTDEPVDADAWIYFRPQELVNAPDLSRTVVQFHDLYGDLNADGTMGRYKYVRDCGGLSIIHPMQIKILLDLGLDFADTHCLLHPIGALPMFTLRESIPEKFTVGWVGRRVRHAGQDIKGIDRLIETISILKDRIGMDILILGGDGLEDAIKEFSAWGIPVRRVPKTEASFAQYPSHYHQMDAMLITSLIEATPTVFFEAMACGVPVVSTPVGWPERLIVDGANGFIGKYPTNLSNGVRAIYADRISWFNRRRLIRASIMGWSMDNWIKQNINLTVEVANGQRVC